MRTRGEIQDRAAAIPPRWGFWKGALTGAVIEVPALAAAVWLVARAGYADASVGFMRTIRLTAVFAGIAAVLTAGGIGRLAAQPSVEGRGGRWRAIWIAGRAHAAASAGLIVIAVIPGGGLPMQPSGWLVIAGFGAIAGLVCGAMIGMVCGGAAPLGYRDLMALARRPSDALRQLLDPEDLVRLGAAVRDRTTNLFDGMFEPGPQRPEAAGAPADVPADGGDGLDGLEVAHEPPTPTPTPTPTVPPVAEPARGPDEPPAS